jgi:hypothetical protein
MAAKTKPKIVIVMASAAIFLAGCWPFHKRETDQQKFMEALNHGNSAQASQIWLGMDAESRAGFAHSQGMRPSLSPDEVKKQLTQHYLEKMGNGDNEETVEQPTPNVHLGGLESLPEYVEPSGAPPQTVTVPTQNEPSN